ncbi:uncharacterized protein Dmoj_GI26270 [Drosophila mojavensis]|uniref:Uncharacterized protein n=1 Tax=Drosophila mojavensis TaxID=7230 RepID=A0A0Q9X862_DROMO|nr:uncharacterized protein Dmoj_GI26270 [Drosophila mojavensis]
MCESREILLHKTAEYEGEQEQPEVIIDVGQLDDDSEAILPLTEDSDAKRFYTCKANNFLKSLSWSQLGILFCVLYNCFIVVILLISFIHSRLEN